MKDNEIALRFSEKFIKGKMTLPSVDGGTYDMYIIEMPNEEGDDTEFKRTFTVPVKGVYDDNKYKYIKCHSVNDRNKIDILSIIILIINSSFFSII